ncbi:hypothetical protein [Halalkalicoccus salilacus]|uniref:hypothetical protein n=1 Tax=Halalkalicoccus sp. GCM10025704 TaxID=3252662 RepID=UPI0036210127
MTGTGGSGVAYLQCRSIGLIGELLAILYAHDIVLDWPIDHRELDGRRGSRVTVIGTRSGIQRAVAELPGRSRSNSKRRARTTRIRGDSPGY